MERTETSQPELSIVMVEDEANMRIFLREALEHQLGYRVLAEAHTGPDMIRAVLEHEPDVVLFDIHLPHLDGLEALRQIYQTRVVAAVAITGDRNQALVKRAMEEHVLAFLVKPIEVHQLGPAIQVAWAGFKELQALTEENASLRSTLESRKIIERAKGLLMKERQLSEADAFRKLQRGAMNRRIPMVDLAKAVLEGETID